MNRYEQIQMCVRIREFVEKKEYGNALELMNCIDLSHFHSRLDQLDFAKVYLNKSHYEDAKELLIPLYEAYPTCHVVCDLFTVSIKLHELVEAAEYLEEYEKMAPKDPQRLIMLYILKKDSGASREELIDILKQLKKEEYTAYYGYELAKLYHKEGRKAECIEECNDLILWFGKGSSIVNKAITLKQLYLGTVTEPLDKIQQAVKNKEEEADKLIEEVTRVCRDLYEDVSQMEEQNTQGETVKTEEENSGKAEKETENESAEKEKNEV